MSKEKLVLTARIENSNPAHAQIGVFQNGGKAGVLNVEAKYAGQVVHLIPASPELLEACKVCASLLCLDSDPSSLQIAACQQAQTAIAKAEGKT